MKYLMLSLILLLTGCTPHLSVNVIKLPQFNIKNKSVAVADFKNDYINLSTRIERELSFLNLKTKNADYFIDGAVFNPTVSSYNYRSSEIITIQIPVVINGVYSYREEQRTVQVICVVDSYSIESKINIINKEGQILFSKNIIKNQNIDYCQDRTNRRRTEIDYSSISNDIASNFAEELKEQNYYRSIAIIDELENKASSKYNSNEILFEKAIKNMKDKNTEEALKLFEQIDDNAARYNIGLIQEARGNYNKALETYFKAGISKEVKSAIQRVKETLKAIQER